MKQRYEYIPKGPPLRKTALNNVHRALRAKIAPFAGWEMPIQYPGGILAEHRAVRSAAGLFDVSHMGTLEVAGPHAASFLEMVLASEIRRLDRGRAQYACLLYPDGALVDDIYVYRLETERFMLVVNAANADRVKDWMAAVNSRRFVIDEEMPEREIDGEVRLCDLRTAGKDSLVGLALQGPASLRVLEQLATAEADAASLRKLSRNAIVRVGLAGISTLAATTGYTGEKTGFEIYARPEDLQHIWGAILEKGRSSGILPAGLGARDSTRIEASLPLFGHEIEGDLGMSLNEAGYGFVVKLRRPFFIGRTPYAERVRRLRRHILRLRGQGRKTLRPGHVILDGAAKVVGEVTSFAYVHEDMTFFALACVEEGFSPEPGRNVLGARLHAEKSDGRPDERSLVELTVMTRFPDDAERAAWPAGYRKS